MSFESVSQPPTGTGTGRLTESLRPQAGRRAGQPLSSQSPSVARRRGRPPAGRAGPLPLALRRAGRAGATRTRPQSLSHGALRARAAAAVSR